MNLKEKIEQLKQSAETVMAMDNDISSISFDINVDDKFQLIGFARENDISIREKDGVFSTCYCIKAFNSFVHISYTSKRLGEKVSDSDKSINESKIASEDIDDLYRDSGTAEDRYHR